jgi:hypothetical protein
MKSKTNAIRLRLTITGVVIRWDARLGAVPF